MAFLMTLGLNKKNSATTKSFSFVDKVGLSVIVEVRLFQFEENNPSITLHFKLHTSNRGKPSNHKMDTISVKKLLLM